MRAISSSCLTAVHEEPPPHRADELADPVRDVNADRLAALACWALTPDNSHHISLWFWGVRTHSLWRVRTHFGRPLAGVGRLGAGLRASLVTPQHRGHPPRYFAGHPGSSRATMRSAVLTVAVRQMSCLREPTTSYVDH